MSPARALASTLILGVIAAAAPAAPVTYTIDPVHSRIVFYINHAGFSNSVGEFKVTEGPLLFDAEDWAKSNVAVQIPVSSLYMGDDKWNTHILSPDFLDVAKYPQIAFTSTKLEKTGTATGKLSGTLTIHGVTKPVVLDVHLNQVGMHPLRKTPATGFTATTTVKRSDFGVKEYLPVVGDDLNLRIEIEAYVPPKG